MKTMKKISFLLGLLVVGASFFTFSSAQAAGGITIDAFDLNPKIVAVKGPSTTFQMTFKVTMDVAQYNAKCGSDTPTFSWGIYRLVTGTDLNRASGEITINRTTPTLTFDLSKSVTLDTTEPDLVSGGQAQYYGRISCPGMLGSNLAESAPATITFGSLTNKTYACVAADNKYACSPASLTNCSDAPACGGRSCVQIGADLCGKDAGTTGPGGGGTGNPGGNNNGGGTTVPPGQDKNYVFNITNPLNGGPNDLFDIISIVTKWILQISIPIAVLLIIYAGFLMLTAGPVPANFAKGKNILTYTILGLAIIFIGRGFISLIISVIELGGSSGGTTSTNQNVTLPNSGPHLCVNGSCINGTAGTCSDDSYCVSPNNTGSTLCVNHVCQNGAKGSCTGDVQCVPPKKLGDLCAKDSECAIGYSCNTICQHNGGNDIGEACNKTANTPNCKSNACSTIGTLNDGICTNNPSK